MGFLRDSLECIWRTRGRLFIEGTHPARGARSGVRRLLPAEEPERPRLQVPMQPRVGDAARPHGRSADTAVASLYDTHYRPLTRLAALLASDEAIAEDIVRDAFVAMHGAWRQLRDNDRAERYLQQTVVRLSRSRRAARGAARRAREQGTPARPGPGVVAALRSLPAPQREALVLRYYADLPETRIASVMGISTHAVNSHLSYGMSSLETALGPH
jgi:DNA-directed RNA polymerase specialized sigma24 family protein